MAGDFGKLFLKVMYLPIWSVGIFFDFQDAPTLLRDSLNPLAKPIGQY